MTLVDRLILTTAHVAGTRYIVSTCANLAKQFLQKQEDGMKLEYIEVRKVSIAK
jgi:hypothetical protein